VGAVLEGMSGSTVEDGITLIAVELGGGGGA
jgi:hypothetical protein